jgi:hypothetical protein
VVKEIEIISIVLDVEMPVVRSPDAGALSVKLSALARVKDAPAPA